MIFSLASGKSISYLFIHLFDRYLLCTYCMEGIVMGSEDILMNKKELLFLYSSFSGGRGSRLKNINKMASKYKSDILLGWVGMGVHIVKILKYFRTI